MDHFRWTNMEEENYAKKKPQSKGIIYIFQSRKSPERQSEVQTGLSDTLVTGKCCGICSSAKSILSVPVDCLLLASLHLRKLSEVFAQNGKKKKYIYHAQMEVVEMLSTAFCLPELYSNRNDYQVI